MPLTTRNTTFSQRGRSDENIRYNLERLDAVNRIIPLFCFSSELSW